MNLKEKAKKTVAKYNMFSSGDAILIGVSGGADSMALLYFLYDLKNEYSLSLKVGHLDHGFRREAAQEADFVREIALSLGLDYFGRFVDVPALMKERGFSAQEAAREARYTFFYETAEESGADRIAIAHTADDQAETLLMRLLRGTGPLGLGGIPPVRDAIIRPFIECSRREIEEFLLEKKAQFVIDSSNLKPDYLRNKVRMELLPLLEEYNPNIRETIARTAEITALEDQYVDREAEKFFEAIAGYDGDSLVLDFKGLKDGHPAIISALLRKAIYRVKGDLRKVSFRHISDILMLISSGEGKWNIHLPDVTVSREHNRLIFIKETGRR